MQHWLSPHRITNGTLSSLLQGFSCLSITAPVPNRSAQGMRKVAPEGGEEQLRFAYIEDAEPPERYRPGGYHPLYIGDVLHRRYDIVHKLGFGSYSTTWLAKDITRHDTYAAIKIKTAESSFVTKETQIWRQLSADTGPHQEQQSVSQAAGECAIPPIWDDFKVEGPNGAHQCIATPPARMTVAEAQDASFTRLAQLRRGSFKPSLSCISEALSTLSMQLLPPDQLYQAFASPVLEPVKTVGDAAEQPLPTGVPSCIVVPAWLGAKSEDVKLHEASIVLTDFGESFMPSAEQRYYSNTPRTIRPPETRFEPEKSLSFAADIWTLACSIWTLLGQRPLFDVFSSTDDYVTREQVGALGKLPQNWWERWAARSEYFDSQGDLLDCMCKRMTLEDRFEHSIQDPRKDCGMEPVSDQEKLALLHMLRSMLAFIPEERPTATSLVACEWMTKWALPDLCQIDRESCEAK